MKSYESKKSALQVSGYSSNGSLQENSSKTNRLARRAAKKLMPPEEYERYIAVVNMYKELKEDEQNG